MKKVTTNISLNQLLFILLTFCFASLMFFYLGAKFGPEILELSENTIRLDDPILPDERLAAEIKKLLKTKKHDFVFYDALQDKGHGNELALNEASKPKAKSREFVSKEVLENIRKEFELKKQQQKESEELKALAVQGEDKQIALDKKKAVLAKAQALVKKQAAVKKKKAEQALIAKKAANIKAKKIAAAKIKAKKAADAKAKKIAAVKALAKIKAQKALAQKKVVTKKVNFLTVKTAEPTVVQSPDWASSEFPQAKLANQMALSSKPAYCLQMGSFAKKAAAIGEKSKWKRRGYSVRVVKMPIKGKGDWYRLRMGGYPSLNDALLAQKSVQAKFKQNIRIVDLR